MLSRIWILNLDSNPFISRETKSLYFSSQSGIRSFRFKVNDTESLAFVQHIGRQVTIIPRSEGSLLITVEDVDLPESLPVTAELLISSVARLNLDT